MLVGVGLLAEVVGCQFPGVQRAVDVDVDDAQGGFDEGLVRV